MSPSSSFISNNSIGSCEASFHSEAVVHIYAKPIRCNAKIKRCHCRTQVFLNVFDVHFSSFPFRLFASKATFVCLEAVCKKIPKYQMLSEGKLHHVARNSAFSLKLTACNVFQNIRFNGSRETRVSSLETGVSSLAMRVSSRESRLARNETRGGNLLLSGTVNIMSLSVTKITSQEPMQS